MARADRHDAVQAHLAAAKGHPHTSGLFEKVELAGRYPLLLEKGTPVKEALVIKATRYNGKVPPENSLY